MNKPILGRDSSTSSVADITITIRDVNDEPPRFNKQEYKVSIPENVPYGTPLANLNMEIKDTDTGINSIFTIELQDPSDKFSIDPVRATGHTAVSLKINKVSHRAVLFIFIIQLNQFDHVLDRERFLTNLLMAQGVALNEHDSVHFISNS